MGRGLQGSRNAHTNEEPARKSKHRIVSEGSAGEKVNRNTLQRKQGKNRGVTIRRSM